MKEQNTKRTTEQFYKYVTRNEVTLKERNMYVFKRLQHFIQKNQTFYIKDILENDKFQHLHISFMKSILIMTKPIEELKATHERCLRLHREKFEALNKAHLATLGRES